MYCHLWTLDPNSTNEIHHGIFEVIIPWQRAMQQEKRDGWEEQSSPCSLQCLNLFFAEVLLPFRLALPLPIEWLSSRVAPVLIMHIIVGWKRPAAAVLLSLEIDCGNCTHQDGAFRDSMRSLGAVWLLGDWFKIKDAYIPQHSSTIVGEWLKISESWIEIFV